MLFYFIIKNSIESSTQAILSLLLFIIILWHLSLFFKNFRNFMQRPLYLRGLAFALSTSAFFLFFLLTHFYIQDFSCFLVNFNIDSLKSFTYLAYMFLCFLFLIIRVFCLVLLLMVLFYFLLTGYFCILSLSLSRLSVNFGILICYFIFIFIVLNIMFFVLLHFFLQVNSIDLLVTESMLFWFNPIFVFLFLVHFFTMLFDALWEYLYKVFYRLAFCYDFFYRFFKPLFRFKYAGVFFFYLFFLFLTVTGILIDFPVYFPSFFYKRLHLNFCLIMVFYTLFYFRNLLFFTGRRYFAFLPYNCSDVFWVFTCLFLTITSISFVYFINIALPVKPVCTYFMWVVPVIKAFHYYLAVSFSVHFSNVFVSVSNRKLELGNFYYKRFIVCVFFLLFMIYFFVFLCLSSYLDLGDFGGSLANFNKIPLIFTTFPFNLLLVRRFIYSFFFILFLFLLVLFLRGSK